MLSFEAVWAELLIVSLNKPQACINQAEKCEIWGSHSGVAQDSVFLECDALLLRGWFTTFWGRTALATEDESTRFLRNVGNYSPQRYSMHIEVHA
jgi:hypothetical protein